VVFDPLTGVIQLPRRGSLVDLVGQRLETFISLEVKDDQPVPRVGGVRHYSEEERNKDGRNGFRILESHSISNLRFTVNAE